MSCPRALCSRVERQTLRKTSKAGSVSEGGDAAKDDTEKREGQGSHGWPAGKERPVRTPEKGILGEDCGAQGTAQGGLGGEWGAMKGLDYGKDPICLPRLRAGRAAQGGRSSPLPYPRQERRLLTQAMEQWRWEMGNFTQVVKCSHLHQVSSGTTGTVI